LFNSCVSLKIDYSRGRSRKLAKVQARKSIKDFRDQFADLQAKLGPAEVTLLPPDENTLLIVGENPINDNDVDV